MTTTLPSTGSRAERSPLELAHLIAPRSIAVIGASMNAGTHAGRTVANLQRTGFAGRIYPVNPRYEELAGLPCYARVTDVGQPIDAAYILVRAERVPDAVRDCVEAGVKTITICSSGYAEEGAGGRALQDEIVALARAGGVRLLGPNCIGSLNISDNVISCPTFNITHDFTAGPISVVSQSGGMAVNILNRAQGRRIGMRAFVSVGNEADLDVAELVEAFAGDPATRVICLYVEQLRDPDRFERAVTMAHAAGKPIIVLKGGKSAAGRRNSLSHTGAMAGSHAVFRSVMRQLGVLEVDTIDQMIDTAWLLSRIDPPQDNRVLIVSPSGGECGYGADRASAVGLQIPPISEATSAALRALMRFGTPGNPLDLTGQVIGDSGLLDSVLAELERAPEFDVVVYAIPTWGATDSERLLGGFIEAARRARKPTIISAWSAANLTEHAEAMLAESGVPYFTSIDATMDALAGLVRAGRRPREPRPELVASSLIERPEQMPTLPSEHESKRFLAEHGIRTSREMIAADIADARIAAGEIGWPLVAKRLCENVVHKSDLGLVRVGLQTPADLEAVFEDFDAIVREHGLVDQGTLLAEQLAGTELIVGGVRDPEFGPVVMIGAGGVLAELLKDTVFLRAPAAPDEVEAAIKELSVARILSGYRGSAAADVSALAVLVSRFSRLFASAPWLSQADLNPIIVPPASAGQATVADAALVLTPMEGNLI